MRSQNTVGWGTEQTFALPHDFLLLSFARPLRAPFHSCSHRCTLMHADHPWPGWGPHTSVLAECTTAQLLDRSGRFCLRASQLDPIRKQAILHRIILIYPPPVSNQGKRGLKMDLNTGSSFVLNPL